MITDYENDPCEVCAEQQAATISLGGSGIHQVCPRCGEFKIVRTANSIMRHGFGKDKRARLSGWIREQNRSGSVPVITNDNLKKILDRPLPSVAERASALLIEAEQGLKNFGDRFNINDLTPIFASAFEANGTQVLAVADKRHNILN